MVAIEHLVLGESIDHGSRVRKCFTTTLVSRRKVFPGAGINLIGFLSHGFLVSLALEKKRTIAFFELKRDRTVFLVVLSKQGSPMREREKPGPLLIAIQAQVTKKSGAICVP
jgi:hypothetical protein